MDFSYDTRAAIQSETYQVMGEKVAIGAYSAGITLFGVSLADLGQMATIFAGVAGGIASLAAGAYWIYKIYKGQ